MGRLKTSWHNMQRLWASLPLTKMSSLYPFFTNLDIKCKNVCIQNGNGKRRSVRYSRDFVNTGFAIRGLYCYTALMAIGTTKRPAHRPSRLWWCIISRSAAFTTHSMAVKMTICGWLRATRRVHWTLTSKASPLSTNPATQALKHLLPTWRHDFPSLQ